MSAAPNPSIGELMARVTALEGTVEELEPRLRLVETSATRSEPLHERTGDHEKRIRHLEGRDKWLMGAVAALAFAGSLLGPVLKALFVGG